MEIDDLPGTPPTSQAMEPGSTGNTVNFSPSSRAAAAEDSPMPLIASDESGLSQPMDESGGSAIRNLTPNLLNQQIMDHFYIQPEDIDDNIRMYATSYFKLNKELTSLQQKHLRDASERINIPKEEILKRESLTDEVEEIKLGIAGYLAEQEEMGYELEKMGGNETDELELSFDMSGGKRKSKKRQSKKRKSKKRSKKRKSKKRSKKSKSKRR